MVSFTTIITAVVALAGHALATSPVVARQAITPCVVGQIYCGFNLLANGGAVHDFWKARVDAALTAAGQPITGDTESSSTFTCLAGNNLQFDEFCLTNGRRCQNANANACTAFGANPGNKNDCCGLSG